MANALEVHPPDHHIEEHPERHEHTDVSIRGIFWTGLIILAVAIITQVMLFYLFRAYERAETSRDEKQVRTAISSANREQAPEPRVQGIPQYHRNNPKQDTLEMKIENRRLLSSFGPAADKNPAFARVPVDLAMEALLKKGLPTAAQPTTQPARP